MEERQGPNPAPKKTLNPSIYTPRPSDSPQISHPAVLQDPAAKCAGPIGSSLCSPLLTEVRRISPTNGRFTQHRLQPTCNGLQTISVLAVLASSSF